MEASNQKGSPLNELLGDKLLKKNEDGAIDEINFADWFATFEEKGEFLCLYFGAHWAPPSRLFTQNLETTFYNLVNAEGLVAEVVFVTHDREQGHFERNFLKMPWLAIPFEDENKKATLGSQFGVCELPTLVVLTHDGKVVQHDARDQISKGARVLDEWREKVSQEQIQEDAQE